MMWTLARASLEGALVVAAIWALSRALTLAPATRTLLWWCAAAKFVLALVWTAPIAVPILPVLGESLPLSAAAHVARPTDVVSPSRAGGVAGVPPGSRSASGARAAGAGAAFGEPLRGLAEWSSYAAITWTGGLLLLAVVGVRRWSETSALVRTSTPAGADVDARARDLAARLSLRRVPAVRVSNRIETPLVTGLFHPVVLLPGERFTALSDRQREMALCHELAHVQRADLWLGCVPALAERLFFFHPLAHFVAREYSVAREAACDAAVIETLDAAPREYRMPASGARGVAPAGRCGGQRRLVVRAFEAEDCHAPGVVVERAPVARCCRRRRCRRGACAGTVAPRGQAGSGGARRDRGHGGTRQCA